MKPSFSTVTAILALAVAAVACSSTPEPVPAPKPTAKPDTPPPPKCEAMHENCKAKSSTRARIPGLSFTFAPPDGWVYAQLEEATVAQSSDRGAVLLLTSHDKLSPSSKRSRERTRLITSLAELVEVKPKGGSVTLFNPNQSDTIAELKMELWERPGATRGGDEGALLIVTSEVEQRELFMLGYAPGDDADGTAAILTALRSLKAGGSSKASEGKSE